MYIYFNLKEYYAWRQYEFNSSSYQNQEHEDGKGMLRRFWENRSGVDMIRKHYKNEL